MVNKLLPGRIGNMTKAQLKGFVERHTPAAGIAVQELDGSPAVTSVSTIKVSNDTLSDNGSGAVTINTAGSPTAYTERLIIAASACDAGSRTQDIIIYQKTANEGIANVRVRWGSAKFNYPASTFYFSVGFFPSGGALDNDSMLAARDIAAVSAGEFIIDEYYTNWGSAWGGPYGGYGHRFNLSTLAHYQEAGYVYVGLNVGAGQVASAISTGTIEVFLDIVDPGAGTTIS